MNLIKTNNCQNTYTCSKPISKRGITNYAWMVITMYKELQKPGFEGIQRLDLLEMALPHKGIRAKIESGETSDRVFNHGYAALSANKILRYSHKTKRWYPGINFGQYVEEYLYQVI